MSRSLKSHFVHFLCVFALVSLLPQQGYAQRSSLPFPLRVLYDSFDADMEMVEGEWWLTFDDLLDETALPVYAYLDEEDDLTLGLLLEEPQFDLKNVLSLKDEVERWKFMEGSSGELLVFDWIFETTEEEILVEFLLSVAEISVFLNSLPSSPDPDEMRFDVAGCMRGIEDAMVGAPAGMRQFFRPEPYCNCLSNLVDEDPDLLLYMLDITSPRSIEAMRTCWPDYCPNCATLGLTFEEVMLGLQEDGEALAEVNDISRRKFILGCVSTGMDLPVADEFNLTYAQMEAYCECAFDRLINEEQRSLADLDDPDGVLTNEVFSECISEHLNMEAYLNEDVAPRGCLGKIRVPILKDGFSGLWKVKVSLGTMEKYLLIDTGASELVIHREWANQLVERGILGRSPIDRLPFVIADGSTVYADIYESTRMSLGGCDFNNFKIAVVPEGGMLCGMGVLGLFDNWQLDEANRQLVLTVE